jgi:hypothetical protein
MKTFKPTKEFYLTNRGAKVRLGARVVQVVHHSTESRGGSWERGFRFYSSKWGALRWELKGTKYHKPSRYSMDHGKTWHHSLRDAYRSKGKMRLETDNHGEFAFEGIQTINREWEGADYRWRR